jgi:D-sedoheptulose 7-phosphate isomerase
MRPIHRDLPKEATRMNTLTNIFDSSAGAAEYARGYFARLAQKMNEIDAGALARIIDRIEQTIASGRTLYLIANGGSAAVASHLVNDAVAGCDVDSQPPFRAVSLCDNVESITAIANDCGYEMIFALQLKALLQPGDMVLAMSVSGNSTNIIKGVEYARAHGACTIGWTGFDGGRLAKACDLCLFVPTEKDEYGVVEDMFSIFEHTILTYLALKRGRKLYH